jgi:hypothetical protein
MKNLAQVGAAQVRQARVRATKGDLEGAERLLLRASETFLSEGRASRRVWALGAAGYLAVMNGKAAPGMTLLQQAARLGYDDLEKVAALAAVRHRGRQLDADPGYRRLRTRVEKNANPISIEEWRSQPVDPWQWMSFCRPADLARLRRHLPRFSRRSEELLIRQCLSWAHTRFEHDPEGHPSRLDPLTILREAKGGRRSSCVESAVLLAAALQASGRPGTLADRGLERPARQVDPPRSAERVLLEARIGIPERRRSPENQGARSR